jgi:hypothetical protein
MFYKRALGTMLNSASYNVTATTASLLLATLLLTPIPKFMSENKVCPKLSSLTDGNAVLLYTYRSG